MAYVKALIVGFIAAMLVMVLWIAVSLVAQLLSAFPAVVVGSDFVFYAFPNRAVLGVALIGFVAGFTWVLRRSRKRLSA